VDWASRTFDESAGATDSIGWEEDEEEGSVVMGAVEVARVAEPERRYFLLNLKMPLLLRWCRLEELEEVNVDMIDIDIDVDIVVVREREGERESGKVMDMRCLLKAGEGACEVGGSNNKESEREK
jgi:hypothetical protein